MPKLKNKPGPSLPLDTYFYSIPLKNGRQELTMDMLNDHYVLKDATDLGKVYVSYISYFDGIASLEVFKSETNKFTIYLRVSPAALDVACTCGMKGHAVCEHTYAAFQKLLYRDNRMDLGRFYWPGFTIDQNGGNRFLNIEVNPHLMFVEPHYKYGNIFKAQTGFKAGDDFSLNNLICEPSSKPSPNLQIAYFTDHVFYGFSTTNLMLIKPALVVADNKNERVIRFKKFLTAKDQFTGIVYTPNHQSLNHLCFQMLSIAAQLPELRKKKNRLDALKANMFELWKAAFPLLEAQKLIFQSINVDSSKDSKPDPCKMSPVNFSNLRPIISFILSDQFDHITVRSILSVKRFRLKPSTSYKPDFITYDEKTSTCYLLEKMTDDDMINWLYVENNKLTILKKHFQEFMKDYLIPLSKRYQILYRPEKSSKLCPFVFDT